MTAGCSEDGPLRLEGTDGGAPSSTAQPEGGGAPTDGGDGDGGGADGAAPPGGGSKSAPTTRAAEPAPGGDAGTPGKAPPAAPSDDGDRKSPGAFARTLLRPEPATALVLERYVQEGADVAATSLSHSARVLGEVSAKPVDTRPPIVLPGGGRAWAADELRATADRSAATPQGGGRAVVRLLLVRGTFEGNEDVLGVALRGDLIALFRDSIASASTPLISGRSIEDAVLLHEIGHLLGLVDIVVDTGRADPEHPGHSKNRDSVMYWAVESGVVTQVLEGGPPKDFDAADLGDLLALRNGA